MDTASHGGKYLSMRTGKTLTYEEFGDELKTVRNASFKFLEDLDDAIKAWTSLTKDELMTVRPLTHWFPVKVDRVKKVLRALPVSETGDVEFKQDRIEVVSGDGADGVVEDRADGVSQLESLGFSLEPIIPDSMVDYNEAIVRKDEPFKDIKFANMTLNQIEAYKEMLSQLRDVESTWLQSFDDSTVRGYEDRKKC